MKFLLSVPLIVSLILSSIPESKADVGSALNQANAFYKKLKADEKKLQVARIKSQHAFRPKSCPIFSKQYASLSAKMNRVVNMLENDQNCMNKIGGTVKNIKSDISKLNKFQQDQNKANADIAALRGASMGDTPRDPLTTQEQAKNDLQNITLTRQIGAVQSCLGNFTSLAQNVACKDALSASDGVGMLSDVIVGTTSLGLMDQGATGVGTGIALGGMAVGSLLKMISILLIDTWDFRKQEDRDNFVKLNCSFFQLKTDMDEVGILEIKTTAHDAEIRRLQNLIKSIDAQAQKLQAAVDKDNKLNKMRNMVKILGKLSEGGKYNGEKNVQLYYLFKEIDSLVKSATRVRGDDMKASMLTKIFDQYQKMITLVNDKDINMGTTGRDLHFPKVAKAYANNNLIGNAKTGKDLWKRILNAPPIGKSDVSAPYDFFLANFLKPVDWLRAIQNQKVNKGRFAQIARTPAFKASIAITKLNELVNQYDSRVNFLSNIKKGAIFSDEDDGTNIKTNILTGFKKIEQGVYGKIGNNFLTYITNNGNKSMKQFKSLMKTSGKYFKGNNNAKCADALRVRQAYNLGQSLTNQGFDFLSTNMDSFYEPNKRTKFLIWDPAFHQRWIQKHVVAVKKAQALIKQNNGSFPANQKNPLTKQTYTTVGELMIKVKQASGDIDTVQRYITNARCTAKKGDTTKLNF